MADDEFSKQAGKAFQGVAIGAAGLVGGLPGVALAVGATGVFNVFEALLTRKTEAFNDARFAALEDEVRKVADEVRTIQEVRAAAGKPLDAPDPLTQGALFSKFAEAVGSAATPDKRTALVHAAARQFDPSRGNPAARQYWFEAARSLTDMEVVVVRLLDREHSIYNERNMVHGFDGKPNGAGRALGLTEDEDTAILTTAGKMAQAQTYVQASSWQGGQKFGLTSQGRMLARYIGD